MTGSKVISELSYTLESFPVVVDDRPQTGQGFAGTTSGCHHRTYRGVIGHHEAYRSPRALVITFGNCRYRFGRATTVSLPFEDPLADQRNK